MRRIPMLAAALLAVPAAWGHAVLLQSTPQAGSTITGKIIPIHLRFNSRIDSRRSRLALVRDGKEELLSIAAESAPDIVKAEIKDARPGLCRLRWQVLASDGHITRGELLFRVK